MLQVVTEYPNNNKNLCNIIPKDLITLHHFVIFMGGLEAKDDACYKVSLGYLKANTGTAWQEYIFDSELYIIVIFEDLPF